MSANRAATWCSALVCASAQSFWSSLNVTNIAVSIPETTGIYLGSPSIIRLSDRLLASHDLFGFGTLHPDTAYTYFSTDNGVSWQASGATSPMYWAQLFTREGDNNVYIMGVGGDGTGGTTQITISASSDNGLTWSNPAVALTSSNHSFSTAPTPVVAWAGRLWRAYEHNLGAGWGSGYGEIVISTPIDTPDLLNPAAWTISGPLLYGTVAPSIPSSWSVPGVISGTGWLEGGAVQPANATDTGMYVMMRVNSIPAVNKGALLYVPAPDANMTFVQWIDPMPGGMSKFAVRRDAQSGLYVTLSNNVEDDSVTMQPTCGAIAAPSVPVHCCGFVESCSKGGGNATCLWCHGNARNNLTLAVSPDLIS